MGEQRTLPWAPNWRLHEEYDVLADRFGEVVHHVSSKEFCAAVDAKASDVSHAVKQREGRHIQAIWLMYALKVAPDLSLAAATVGPADLEVRRVVTDTPEQRAIKLELFIRRNPIVERAAKEEGVL